MHRRLAGHYGVPEERLRLPPVAQLVLSFIGTRSKGEQSMAVFEKLFAAYGSWEAVAAANPADLFGLLEPLSFAEDKAYRLPLALQQIARLRGRLDLAFLADWPVEAAMGWLTRLPGVGPKVAAAVLNFSTLDRRALVIDSHHLRVLRRLGLVRRTTTLEGAYPRLERLTPEDWDSAALERHHTLMKGHGQQLCRLIRPDCPACPLRDICAYASGIGGRRDEAVIALLDHAGEGDAGAVAIMRPDDLHPDR
ncbi:endonuclease III domain-containing protein [Oceanibaculum pacificum]|uniref:endonuclease III domain-containing protein n=1 Tax=Oceanibaculum pacificum TaxID=580166 RepID=UPI0012ED32CA|nr:iron-sulfur cluster loop [Oceanibaculum pacificum]